MDCVVLYGLFEGAWDIYGEAIKRPDLQGDNLDRAICEIYIEVKLTEPYVLARSTEIVSKQLPDKVREERFAEELTGYYLTQLSTSPSYRLGRALCKLGPPSRPPSSALLQELPAQALVAWAERGDQEFVLKKLRGRIAGSIANLASEASIRPAKVEYITTDEQDDEEADELTSDPARRQDPDLEEFEDEETLRQQLAELREWIERAGLSKQERKVYELDMSTDYDTEAVARELDIDPGQVRVVRHNYKKKIVQAAGL